MQLINDKTENTLSQLEYGQIAKITGKYYTNNLVVRCPAGGGWSYMNLFTGKGINYTGDDYKCYIYPKGTEITIRL